MSVAPFPSFLVCDSTTQPLFLTVIHIKLNVFDNFFWFVFSKKIHLANMFPLRCVFKVKFGIFDCPSLCYIFLIGQLTIVIIIILMLARINVK